MNYKIVEKILFGHLPLDDVLSLVDSIDDEETLFELIQKYNWDMDFEVVYRIAENPSCSLAAALCLLYDADGVAFMMGDYDKNSDSIPNLYELDKFLYKRIKNGYYKKGNVRYNVPITEYRKRRLFEEGVKPIFLKDV